MKWFKLSLFFVCLIVSAWVVIGTRYKLSGDYKVTINGTSNLHNWNETVENVTGESSISWSTDGSFNLGTLNIKMAVRSIRSEMGAIMNSNTYKALKADNNPEIIFTLTVPVESIKPGSTSNTVSAKGNLTIAGVTKLIVIQVKVTAPDHNKLYFEGSQSIKMTDYGIDPPTALFGTLKTGDEISITFKTSFSLSN
jgi:polyisoprenoid-binding protein YceI